MEAKIIFIALCMIIVALVCVWIIVKIWSKPIDSVHEKEHMNPIITPIFHEPSKEIWKVSTILRQCERWVDTNEHEMASIYYEIIANECKKLSEEHKKSI